MSAWELSSKVRLPCAPELADEVLLRSTWSSVRYRNRQAEAANDLDPGALRMMAILGHVDERTRRNLNGFVAS